MQIALNNLVYKYERKSAPALAGITAEIGPGVHLLLGENGAGKTTLLHILAGLRKATSGTCTIDGTDTSRRDPQLTSRTFYCGSDIPFCARNIADMARIHGSLYPNFSEEVLAENLTRFGISAGTKLSKLSLGNLQKAKVAYSLALGTDIVLLDEPGNGLDIESKTALRTLIAQSATPERTIIVSTHNYTDIQQLCDGIIILRGNNLVLADTLDSICRRIAFVRCPMPPADALYSEAEGGRYTAIVPSDSPALDSCAEADFDYRLLYCALHTDDYSPLLKVLGNEK